MPRTHPRLTHASLAFALATLASWACVTPVHPSLPPPFFPIVTHIDPQLSGNRATDLQRYQVARAAYFNILSGVQNENPIFPYRARMDYVLDLAATTGFKALIAESGFHEACFFAPGDAPDYPATMGYLNTMVAHYSGLPAAQAAAVYGYFYKDEPGLTKPATFDCPALSYPQTIGLLTERMRDLAPGKPVWINLLPRYGFNTNTEYEAYLDAFLKQGSSYRDLDIVSYDHYPFLDDPASQDRFLRTYFYNLREIRERSGVRPFWGMVLATAWSTYDIPTAAEMRFMALCPIAYGARGLGYYTYAEATILDATHVGGLVDRNGNTTPAYATAQEVNRWITFVLGPVALASKNLGAYHQSTSPDLETLPPTELVHRNTTPLVASLGDSQLLAGVFRDDPSPTTYYVMVVNKDRAASRPATVTLKGDYRNKVSLAPRLIGYTSGTAYTPLTATYSTTTSLSTVSLGNLAGGEACILKVTGVTDPRVAHLRTDYDGDGRSDLSLKLVNQDWGIDYAANGFGNRWDLKYTLTGDATAHPVPADYDGDALADLSVKSDDGRWLVHYSANGLGPWDLIVSNPDLVGANRLAVPADFDGDGLADFAIRAPSGTWYLDLAQDGLGSWNSVVSLPAATGVPVPADYDGDGRADLSFKEDGGAWRIDYAANGYGAWDAAYTGYGNAISRPYPGDYDGDGRADLAIKIDGNKWKIDYSKDGFESRFDGDWSSAIGQAVPGDYDGDGKWDLAVRTSTGDWKIDYSANGYKKYDATFTGYGGANDVAPYRSRPVTPDREAAFRLSAARPNPFLRNTVFEFDLPSAATVRLEVFDVAGRHVRTLWDGPMTAGSHSASWDRTDSRGVSRPAGVYFYRLEAGNRSATRRLIALP